MLKFFSTIRNFLYFKYVEHPVCYSICGLLAKIEGYQVKHKSYLIYNVLEISALSEKRGIVPKNLLEGFHQQCRSWITWFLDNTVKQYFCVSELSQLILLTYVPFVSSDTIICIIDRLEEVLVFYKFYWHRIYQIAILVHKVIFEGVV